MSLAHDIPVEMATFFGREGPAAVIRQSARHHLNVRVPMFAANPLITMEY